MEFIPVQTRVLRPPQDDLFSALKESLPVLKERDIIVVSSKVVSINEGRAVAQRESDRGILMQTESDLVIPRPYWKSPLTAVHHAFISSAGMDTSNGDGYLILLPKDPFASAASMRNFIRETFGLTDVGVIIIDSHSTPFRYGASGIAIGWSGIVPIEDCRGREDLFGESIKYERMNLVDGLAAAANIIMGEVAERTPVVIARDVPRVEYTERDTKNELFVSLEEDTFRVLYERFL
jgi:F420-0:gamma-glutamyl ligase